MNDCISLWVYVGKELSESVLNIKLREKKCVSNIRINSELYSRPYHAR